MDAYCDKSRCPSAYTILSKLSSPEHANVSTNLVFSGQRHTGKHSYLYAFLNALYGTDVTKASKQMPISLTTDTSNTSKSTIRVIFSPYHVEVMPFEQPLRIKAMLKQLAAPEANVKDACLSHSQATSNPNRVISRTVVMHEFQLVKPEDQEPLKCMTEDPEFKKSWRFIFLFENDSSSALDAIKSRMTVIRFCSATPHPYSLLLDDTNVNVACTYADSMLTTLYSMIVEYNNNKQSNVYQAVLTIRACLYNAMQEEIDPEWLIEQILRQPLFHSFTKANKSIRENAVVACRRLHNEPHKHNMMKHLESFVYFLLSCMQ